MVIILYTKLDFINDLKNSGLLGNETIMIHSAYSSIKNIDGGTDTVLSALKEYFKDGLVLIPTHTWASIREDNQINDLKEANSCVGYLTNQAILNNDFVRSHHPTHSVCAYGKKALDYIKRDDNSSTPANPEGCFGALKYDGYIMFIGAPLSKNTFVHSIEEEMNVPDRFTNHIYTFYSKDDNNTYEYHMPRHYNEKCPHISDNYEKLLPLMLKYNIAKQIKLLDSTTYLVNAKLCRDLVIKILSNDIHAFDDNRDISMY